MVAKSLLPGQVHWSIMYVSSHLAVFRSSLHNASTSFQKLHTRIRRYFPQIPPNCHIAYHTTELAIGLGEEIEIPPEAWGAVIPKINKLIVRAADRRASSSQGSNPPGSVDYSATDHQVTIKDTGKNEDNGKFGNDSNHNQATYPTRTS